MKNLLIRNIKGSKVALLFILTNLIYTFMLLKTIPNVMDFAGGMKLLDMLPTGYNFAYINDLFEKLGDAGRNAYLYQQIAVDMVYPALFAISYALLLAFFIKKLKKLDGSMVYLCALPVVAGLFDYMENIGIISMLTSFPDLNPSTVAVTNIFTVAKSAITTIYFVVLLVVIIVVGVRYLKARLSATKSPQIP